MAGEQEGSEGRGSAEGAGDDWSVTGDLPAGEQIQQPGDQEPASPVPIKKAAKPKPEEGQEPEPEGEAEPEGTPEGEEEPEGEPEGEPEVAPEVAQLQAQLANMQRMADFFQTKYNEMVQMNQGQQPSPQTPEQQGQPGQPTPQGLMDPPAQWESTKQVVDFFDKRTDVRTQQKMGEMLQKGFQQMVVPALERINQAMNHVIEKTIKPNLKDWDEVMEDVHDELFILDKSGKQVINVKNQALLDYFRAQPVPVLAMYEHGLAKKAPQKIKEGVQKANKDTIQKIQKKPKAPTQVKSGHAQPDIGDLDWDTPASQAEKILAKKKLL